MINKDTLNTLLKVFNRVKPLLICVVVVLILRATGILSAVSSATQYALLQTGARDAAPDDGFRSKKFDYDFALTNINQEKLDFQTMKGKVIFINVWATWCGPCRVEMPSIQNLYNSVNRDSVNFIMLSVDQKDPQKKVAAYLADKGFTFPVYFPDGNLPEQLQVRSIPATFVISKEGKIVFNEYGAANYDTPEFRDFLKSLR